MTVTPAVEVVRVAEIPVSVAQPLFFTPMLRLTHSFLLTTPLPLPPEFVSSMVKPFPCRFDVPAMQKFCAAVPPPGIVTEADAGVEVAQFRAASAGVAV